MARPDKDIPISRAVGRFFGHLFKAAATPVEPDAEPDTESGQKVRETREERQAEIGGKPVVLRRTTVEEIEFPEGTPPQAQPKE